MFQMKYFLSILLAIVVGLFLINSYGSAQTVVNRTGVRAVTWGALFLALFGFARVHWQFRFPKKVVIASFLFGSFSILLGICVGVWMYLAPPNYVFNLLKLQPFPLVILGNGLWIVVAASLPNRLSQKYSSLILRGIPIWFLGISAWVTLLPFDQFITFTHEDGLVEEAQFIFVLFTTSLLFLETHFNAKLKNKSKTLLFAVVTLAFFFVAMEEISWGQRIFHFSTPTELQAINVQNETTIHNIGILNALQQVGYIGLCVLGTVGGFLHSRKKEKWNVWIPTILPWFLFIPAIYYIVFVFNKNVYPWAEVMEMLFYSGLLLWVIPHIPLTKKYFVKS